MKKFKKVLAMMLAIVMVVGTVNLPGKEAKAAESVTLSFNSDSSVRDGNKDYIIYLDGLTTEQVNALGAGGAAKVNTILIDGKKCGAYGWNLSGRLAILVNWTHFNSEATSAADVGRHFVTIPKGSTIGANDEYTVAEDATFYINGANKPIAATNLVSFTMSASTTRTKDYQFVLQGLTKEQLDVISTAGISLSSGDVLIDGEVAAGPYCWNLGSGNLGFMTNYTHIISTATSPADITEEHLITLQKGTKIGTYMIEHDLNFKVNGTSMEWVNTEPTLSIAANREDVLMLKADEIETPSADIAFEAADSSAVYQYNGVASQYNMIYSKHGGIYAEVSGMTGGDQEAAKEGDVITIKGNWKYLGDRKVYDFGNTNYTWNGTEWVKGLIVDSTPVTFTILQPTRTNLLLLKINEFPYDGINVAKDTKFEAFDENSVYQFNGTDLSIQPHFAYEGLYNTVQAMAGRTDAEDGDTVVIGGVWKHLYDGKYYDFGEPKTYKWNGTNWIEVVKINAITPTLSLSGSSHSKALILAVAEIDVPTGDVPFQAYENTVYAYYDASSDTTTTYTSKLNMSKHGGIYVTPAGDATPVAGTGDRVTIGGIWQYTGDNQYYDFGDGVTYEWSGSKWTVPATPMTMTTSHIDWRTNVTPNDWMFYLTPSFTVEETEAWTHLANVTIKIKNDGVESDVTVPVHVFKDVKELAFEIEAASLPQTPATGATVTFPAGLIVTYKDVSYKLARDVVYKYDGTKFVEEIQYTDYTLSWGTDSQSDDPNTRYFTYPTGASAVQAAEMHQQTATIYVDDTPVENGVEFWNDNGKLLLLFQYDKIQNGVTAAADMELHNISIPAGTIVGYYRLTEDFNFHVEQETIVEGHVSTYPLVSLGWGTGSEQNDNTRYLFYPEGATAEQISALHGKTADAYVDGELVSGAVNFHNAEGTLLMLLPYSKLETGVSEAVKLQPHSIVIKKGTIIGEYQLAADYKISVDGSTVLNTEDLTEVQMHMSMTEKSAAQDYYDAEKTNPTKRYLLYFEGFDATSIADIHQQLARITVDGATRVLDGNLVYYNVKEDNETITMLLPYEVLESGVTECAQFKNQHTVTIKKGTIIADKYVVSEELTIPLDKDQIMHSVVKDAVTTSVDGTVLTIGGTGTIKASDLAAVTAANITKIKIEGPSGIASQAFAGFTALTEVYFSNTVLTAADDAFSGCASGVKAIYVKGRSLTGGLENVDGHEYYSFKVVTIGSSFGEDTNNYLYTLAKQYYSNLPGRSAEDIAYDDIVVAELFTGGGTLEQRVNGILGNPQITCYWEKWDENGVSIPTSPLGQLTGDNMRMALQNEYWDIVILMQGAHETKTASTFLADTEGKGRADIDTMIDFVKTNNKNNSGSKYLWLQTWSYNWKVNGAPGSYASSVANEENERLGIVDSMKNVVQKRVDGGALDGILPVGASIEYLKKTWLNAEDAEYVNTTNNGTYNEGVYSNYFALQRDSAHASIGLGRFTLGLTAFGYLAELENAEIQVLAKECYPQNYAECEVSAKLEGEQSQTKAYLEYDEYTKDCAPQAYSAAIKALADPYMEGVAKVYKTGDANGDGEINSLDLIRYKKAQTGDAVIVDEATADINMDAKVDATDLAVLRAWFVGNQSNVTMLQNGEMISLLSGGIYNFASGYTMEKIGTSALYATKGDCYAPKTVALTWEEVEGAVSYTVKLATKADLSDAKSYEAASNTLRLTNLLSGTHYYYQVIAVCGAETEESQVYDFKTEALPRTVYIDGVSNTRDIGGYYTEDGQYRIKQDIVWRSGRLNDITATGQKTLLEDFGVKTVLALNADKNDSTYLGAAGLNYVSVSAPWYAYEGDGVVAAKYREALLTELRVFADADNYPIVFHCSAGKDRTGTLAALLNALCGVSEKDLYLDYELSAFSHWLWETDYPEGPVARHMSWFNDFMTYLNGFEGETLADKTENFMLSIGMTATEIQNIRANLREEI